ncbi:MAG: hypothetical protein ACI9RO_002057 [Alteromonas macleodii]|jgi:hypothetical protein
MSLMCPYAMPHNRTQFYLTMCQKIGAFRKELSQYAIEGFVCTLLASANAACKDRRQCEYQR